MVYLSEPKSGGFTTFPQLGITLPPKQALITLMTTTAMILIVTM